MSQTLWARALDAEGEGWPEQLRRMRRELRDRPSLLPHHFLEVVLPKIGGVLLALTRGRCAGRTAPVGYAFLLPRALTKTGPAFTLRYEHRDDAERVDDDAVSLAVGAELPPGHRTLFYGPDRPQTYSPSYVDLESASYGRPSAEEAAAVRAMQQKIWGSPEEGLYPSDLHSNGGGLGSSLVARVDGALAGFVLGFNRFESAANRLQPRLGQRLQLESQLLAVAPARRGRGIAYTLKRMQAQEALESGIGSISWTADPLLFPNALLNFTRLRAVAFDFQPSMYSFRNALNRVPASRLNLLWNIGSARVQNAMKEGMDAAPQEIQSTQDMTIVNRGTGKPVLNASSERIAIEIPANWVDLQRGDHTRALRWREITNRLFINYIGTAPGKYIVTEGGIRGERRYLICRRVHRGLLNELSEAAEKG